MDNSKILIGKPISNTKVYILNEDQMLMPLGAVGEICISGDGLAKGYLYKTELTNEKFITNVFDSEERIYRTGDLGKWLADGNIEYIGRKDDQVKIRGYRIEIGEIEASFKLNKKVEDVVVIAKKLSGSDKELIAYLVSNEALNINDLKSTLSKNLPSFMIPGYYIQLDKIPLTPNGKINKQALPDPQEAALINATKYKAPENEIERKLVDIWSEILVISKDRIGINDNFFDLGGHSLKAIRAITQITKEFGVSLKAEEIFNNSNIEFIAKKIARSKWLAESMNQSMNQDDKIVI